MPKQIHILFNLLALFVISYIVVDTFYRVVEIQLYQIGGPKVVALKEVEMRGEKSLKVPGYAKIVERNIFGATEKVEKGPVEEVKPLETLEETSLQLSLHGTIAGDSASARAIILDQRKRSQDIYRVGDSVQEAQIKQILRGKVVLRHGDKDEILTMVEGDDKPGAAEPILNSRRRPGRQKRRSVQPAPLEEPSVNIEEVTIPVEKDVLQDSLNNLNDLMTQVRVRPYFRRGKPEGLIVSQIKSDSVFAKLGLMNGDIIANVNGKPMSSPEEAFQFYNSLKSG
ncbi:type II secretion system protein GspC, partial [Thermodesulfobacteriota bacterium]